MLILDTFSVLENGKLTIPFYHRGHLSLMTGTEATIVYLPGQKRNPTPAVSELIISPIVFRSWQYLTRINARLANHPGLIRKLLTALAVKDLEVLYHAAGPIENGQLLRVEFLVDAKSFYDEYEDYLPLKADRNNADYKILSELEIWLKSLFIDYLDWDLNRARLKVRPMEAFRRAWKIYRECRNNDDFCQTSAKGTATIKRGWLALPDSICKVIPMASNRVMFLSDTKDRMLRGILFNPLDSCTYLRVEHKNTNDSSSVITNALSKYFLIVTTLSRVKTQSAMSMIEFMLFSPELPLQYYEEERRRLISQLLSDPHLADLDIRVCYPQNVGIIGSELRAPVNNEGIIAEAQTDITNVPLERDLMSKLSGTILIDKMNYHYARITDSPRFGASLNSQIIHSACRELLSKIGHQKLDQSIIFVSYPFQFKGLFKILEKYLHGLNYRVVTGGDIESGDAFRKTIISRIKSAHGFIGIWKLNEKAESINFSPWLSWELAIAQSCEIPARIFPHEHLNLNDPAFTPHRKILPEINMLSFSDCDFTSYVEKRLDSFHREVQAYEKKILHDGPNQYSSTN